MNIVAFETMNQVRLELRMSVVDRRGRADIVIAALAHDRNHEIGEVPPLGSVSVSCLGSRLRSLDAALIHACISWIRTSPSSRSPERLKNSAAPPHLR